MNEPFPPLMLEKLLALSQSIGDEIRQSEILKANHFGNPESWSPRLGQVWRVKAEKVILLILILGIIGTEALVCPVTIEPASEDENCIITIPPVGFTPCPLIIWLGIKRIIKTSLFDKPFDDFGIEFIYNLRDKKDLPDGFRIGRPLASIFSEDATIRAEIEDGLNFLAKFN